AYWRQYVAGKRHSCVDSDEQPLRLVAKLCCRASDSGDCWIFAESRSHVPDIWRFFSSLWDLRCSHASPPPNFTIKRTSSTRTNKACQSPLLPSNTDSNAPI